MSRTLRFAAIPFLVAVLLLTPAERIVVAAPQNAAPATVDAILKAQSLSNAYNPVLLEYLLAEGRPKLRAAQHKQAVDQLVARFRQEMTVTGTEGGLVVAVADDVGMSSSQNEQDSRFWARFAHLPLFGPARAQESYDMAREAFDISARFRKPVILRLVTRLSHFRAVVGPPGPRAPTRLEAMPQCPGAPQATRASHTW